MKICVIGQGYIGIPTAMVLAEQGYNVIGIDKDKDKVKKLKNHMLPFHEHEFTEYSKKIFLSTNYRVSEEITPADVFIICVPTPFTKAKTCDYKYIYSALEDIIKVITKGNLIVLESTVPPRTCEDIIVPHIQETGLKASQDFFVSHAPERLLPGNILHEIIYNDRIIGGIDEKSTQMTYDIYSKFTKGSILLTDATTAEMSKCTENTFRDVNIALANELAIICETLNINPYEVIELANHHPRVDILNPGPGVGGHCIPIDPWFIVEKAPDKAKLITQSRKNNDYMPEYVVNSVINMIKGINKPKIAILGAAYKPNVDDPRESPTKEIIEILKKKEVDFMIHDPIVKKFSYSLNTFDETISNADCLLYVVNHDEYKGILNLDRITKLMKNKNVFICGNFAREFNWKKKDFNVKYLGIKR